MIRQTVVAGHKKIRYYVYYKTVTYNQLISHVPFDKINNRPVLLPKNWIIV